MFPGCALSISLIAAVPGRFRSDRVARDEESRFPRYPLTFINYGVAEYHGYHRRFLPTESLGVSFTPCLFNENLYVPARNLVILSDRRYH